MIHWEWLIPTIIISVIVGMVLWEVLTVASRMANLDDRGNK